MPRSLTSSSLRHTSCDTGQPAVRSGHWSPSRERSLISSGSTAGLDTPSAVVDYINLRECLRDDHVPNDSGFLLYRDPQLVVYQVVQELPRKTSCLRLVAGLREERNLGFTAPAWSKIDVTAIGQPVACTKDRADGVNLRGQREPQRAVCKSDSGPLGKGRFWSRQLRQSLGCLLGQRRQLGRVLVTGWNNEIGVNCAKSANYEKSASCETSAGRAS